MGIDYIIDLDCQPKQALSTEGIVNLVKARVRAETIIELSRAEGDERPPSELTFEVAVNRMGTLESVEVSAQELLDQAVALDEHRATCMDCPANRDNPNGFGCYKSITYPLEADTERFLLSRLPDKLESGAGYMLTSALRDFGWQGEHAAEMRAQGDTFFRLRTAPARSWPGLTITGDQMFHMMFHLGYLQPSHSMMLCLFFGLLMVNEEEDARPSTTAPESDNALQMVDFLNTLGFAARAKLDVLIDG